MSGISKRVSGSWVSDNYGIMKTATDTITTPADIYANDTTATVGLKGQMEQSSTPTPTTPIQPQECGERTGNLCDSNPYKTGYAINGYGTETQNSEFNIYTAKVSAETQYRLSFVYPESASGRMVRIHEYSGGIWQSQLIAQNCNLFPSSFTTSANIDEVRISIINTTSNHMINTGSTTLPYEPYGIKIPILNNSQTTNVYLGEVQTTRKIKKYEMTGNEDITYQSAYSRFFFTRTDAYYTGTVRTTPCICSHYQSIHDGRSIDDIPNESIYVATADNKTAFNIKTTDFTDVTDFKSYLAQQYANGSPITIWYILATSTTGIVNEPIRKIGNYADEVSGITIPTTAGANTLSVDTTLQPSEVTVNYKGWHPVADVHERESGQWD